MSNHIFQVLSTQHHTVKNQLPHLKVEVKGRNHVCIVRKALQGHRLTIRVDNYEAIHSIQVKLYCNQIQIMIKTHLLLFQVITNGIIPVTSFSL